MTIQETNFIFDGKSSDMYEIIMVDFDTPTASNDEETSLLTAKSASSDKWDLYGVEYSSPLTSKITIVNKDGTYVNSDKQRELKKWLCKHRYSWFQVDQADLSNIYYRCILNNPQMVNIGRMNGGISFTMTCDSPYAWSQEMSAEYAVTNDTGSFIFNHVSDIDEYILCPVVTITSNIAGTIEIINTSDSSRKVKIENCTVGEVITLDGTLDKISSSNGRVVLNSWNKKFLEMIEGGNNLTINGNCTVKLTYRLPRRVGA